MLFCCSKSEANAGFPDFPLTIRYDGILSRRVSEKFSIFCAINTFYFPYDIQDCMLVVRLIGNANFVRLGDTQEHTVEMTSSGWDIIHNHSFIPGTGNSSYRIHMRMILKRKPKTYVASIILPVFILSLMSTLVFVITPESGEKVSFGITIFLAFTVFLLLVFNVLP